MATSPLLETVLPSPLERRIPATCVICRGDVGGALDTPECKLRRVSAELPSPAYRDQCNHSYS